MAAIDRAIREIGKKTYRGHATIPTKSTFLKDGKLTPDEFVAAGDALKAKCPQWNWFSLHHFAFDHLYYRRTGDESHVLSYLPHDKQFLEYKGIPCRVRASQVTGGAVESSIGEGTGDDEWLDAAGSLSFY